MTIVELKAPIKTSKRYTPPERKYNTLWGSVKCKVGELGILEKGGQFPVCMGDVAPEEVKSGAVPIFNLTK